MKLTYPIEHFDGTLQEWRIETKEVNSLQDAEELSYDDFKILYFEDGQFIRDHSELHRKAGTFIFLVDSVDWVARYKEQLINQN